MKLPLEPDPAWGLGLGVALFVVALGAVWGSVHLREKAHDEWAHKVELAFAGLQERATDIFEELRSAIDAVVPPVGAPFDPTSVIADPAPVGKLAKRAVKALKERKRIRSQFRIFLRVCSVLEWLSFILAGAVVTSTVLFFLRYEDTNLWQFACLVTVGIFASGVVLVVLYAVLRGRLQQSYEHSESRFEVTTA